MKKLNIAQAQFVARVLREADTMQARVRMSFPGSVSVHYTHTGHILVMDRDATQPQHQYPNVDALLEAYGMGETVQYTDPHGRTTVARDTGRGYYLSTTTPDPRAVVLELYNNTGRARVLDAATGDELLHDNEDFTRAELLRRGYVVEQVRYVDLRRVELQEDGTHVVRHPRTGLAYDPATGKLLERK